MNFKSLTLLIATLLPIYTFSESETITDVCGNTYPIVTIGTQTWMTENLRCDKYDTQSEAYNASWLTNNTIPISRSNTFIYTPYYTNASDKSKWYSTKYSDNLNNEQILKFGYLYNWAAATGVKNGEKQTSAFSISRQGICPNGWHVPTKAEWNTLGNYIDGNSGYTDAGKHLKTTSGWYKNGNGTDDYGFSILPVCDAIGNIVFNIGNNANFWTASPNEGGSSHAYSMGIIYDRDYLNNQDYYKYYGQSVRCIKGAATYISETKPDSTPSVSKQLIDGKIVIISGDKQFDLNGIEIK